MGARILVVDDDAKISSLLRRSLAFEGFEVKTAASGEEALQIALPFEPELVILDIMMPGLDGWEVCKRLRAAGDTAILMVTARDDVEDRVRGLDLGADDYLVKPFALEELLARVRALLRRGGKRKEKQIPIHHFVDLSLDEETRECRRGKRMIQLTAKEYDLMLLFMQNPRKVIHRDRIMEEIWGFDYSGESNVLEVYIAMLRQKLEEQGEARLIHTVRGAGYVLRRED